jgi:glycosyltransferase involved in cell wall biosynthesis
MSEHAPLVSVVIPCFNQAHFLDNAIESILRQTHPCVEIVVVDDGSTDSTEEVARQYPDVRYVRQPNSGLASARNAGIRHSTGGYLVFLDADDRLLPEALGVGLAELRRQPDCAFVSGHFRFIDRDGRPQPEWTREPCPSDPYEHLLRLNYVGMVATVMFQRAALVGVGGFRSHARGAEDYDAYLRITRLSPVCHHDRIVAEYRRYGEAMSDDALRMLTATLRALRAQRRHARARDDYAAAYREGVVYWRTVYLHRASEQVRSGWRARELRRGTLRRFATLAWSAPMESIAIARELLRRDRVHR